MEGEIREFIDAALAAKGLDAVAVTVEHPADESHGDYATNAALVAAKRLGANPRALAEDLVAQMAGKSPNIESIEVAGPGFINFHLARSFFAEAVANARAKGDAYGTNDTRKGEEILFEYTSPNLWKPLHVGNLVGNIVGESVSRLFEAEGATLRRINYPSDIGLTVAKGVWGLKKTGGDPEDINAIGEAYRVGNEAYETDETAKTEIEAVNRALYAGDDEGLKALRERGLRTSHRHLMELCRMLGTSFDLEIRESEVSDIGTELVRTHTGDVFVESDGAVVFPGEQYGLHTRVFLNSQGLPTYEAKDLGNFARKERAYPHWTHSYIVTGGEQREYFMVLFEAMRRVFPDTADKILAHIPTGFLTLTTGKMSSRKGNVLTAESLLASLMEEVEKRATESRAENLASLVEEVAVGALKYQILRQAAGQDIVFDKERALSLEGDSGPYLMYAHARMSSIEEKAAAAGMHAGTDAPEVPYALERFLYRFPEVVLRAGHECAPHHLVVYLTELASRFNAFYAVEKIVDDGDPYAPYKLSLTKAARVVLRNGLALLGIAAPERM